MIIVPAVAVGPSGKRGRGIFALKNFQPQELIEVCPAIKFPNREWEDMAKTILRQYAFSYDDDSSIIALGYGSLYNHSYNPNAFYQKGKSDNTLDIIAFKPILRGQEIFINYNADPYDQSPLWFDAL